MHSMFRQCHKYILPFKKQFVSFSWKRGRLIAPGCVRWNQTRRVLLLLHPPSKCECSEVPSALHPALRALCSPCSPICAMERTSSPCFSLSSWQLLLITGGNTAFTCRMNERFRL